MTSWTPGLYLQRRREARDLSRRELAILLARQSEDIAVIEPPIEAAELDQKPLGEIILDRLHDAIGFDRRIYGSLRDGLPCPPLCTDCGCSWGDPCTHEDGRPCAWTDVSATRCTVCADKAAALAAVPRSPT